MESGLLNKIKYQQQQQLAKEKGLPCILDILYLFTIYYKCETVCRIFLPCYCMIFIQPPIKLDSTQGHFIMRAVHESSLMHIRHQKSLIPSTFLFLGALGTKQLSSVSVVWCLIVDSIIIGNNNWKIMRQSCNSLRFNFDMAQSDGGGCYRIHQLHLCRRVRPHQRVFCSTIG